jgi:hypothetical protein
MFALFWILLKTVELTPCAPINWSTGKPVARRNNLFIAQIVQLELKLFS